MGNKVDALKKFAVALGYGTAVTDYTGDTFASVLKEMAVKMGCASSVDDIRSESASDVLKFIADNYGTEEREPFDLGITATNVTVTVKRKGKAISAGTDKLYNGDELVITAEGATGYDVGTLTVNGTAFVSGNKFTVNGHNVAIVATGVTAKFDLARTVTNCTVAVTKGGSAVADGTDVLTHGDVITITATADAEKSMSSLKVNGEDFVSGNTLTVSADVAIVAVAE